MKTFIKAAIFAVGGAISVSASLASPPSTELSVFSFSISDVSFFASGAFLSGFVLMMFLDCIGVTGIMLLMQLLTLVCNFSPFFMILRVIFLPSTGIDNRKDEVVERHFVCFNMLRNAVLL